MSKRALFSGLLSLLWVLIAAGCDSSGAADGDVDWDVDRDGDTNESDSDSAACADKALSCDGAWTRSCQGGVWVRVTDCTPSGARCVNGACVDLGADGDESEGDVEAETEADFEPEPDADTTDREAADERESELSESEREPEQALDGDLDDDAERDEAQQESDVSATDGDSESAPESDRETDTEAESSPEAEEEGGDGLEAERDSEAEPETEEAETEAPCSDGPCCAAGRWLAAGEPCLSGTDAFDCTADVCDAAHACSVHTLRPGKCLIDAVCYDDGQSAPGEPCLRCAAAQPLVWSATPTGYACDDKDPCSYGEVCDGLGACASGALLACPSATDACGARRACNGTESCTVDFPAAQTPCEPDSLACTDDLCDGRGLCLHQRQADACLIEGLCYARHAINPGNECQWCDPLTNAWVAKGDGDACLDDGNPCTNDVCRDGGCAHPPKELGTACDDGLFCNGAEACDGAGVCEHAGDPCLLGGVCENACDEARDDCHASPLTPCRDAAGDCETAAFCDGAGVCPPNAPLEDGTSCGTNDQCYSGVCVDCTDETGCAETPDDGLPCTETVCDTTRHACVQNPAAHFAEACGDPTDTVCDAPDSCDADGVCRPNLEAASVACDDGNPCTLNDHCDGLGACAAGTPQTCGGHGQCTSEGRCVCQATFGGDSCQSCAAQYWGYPDCKPKVVSASTGSNYSCALLVTGVVKCWGANIYGQLGDGTTANHLAPTEVLGLTEGVKQISSGSFHACALLNSGGVMCWGWNIRGQLGDGTSIDRSTAVAVQGLGGKVAKVQCGGYHTCALMESGGMKCWGNNEDGQLGYAELLASYVPKDVSGLSGGVSQISSGARHSCAVLAATGAVKCWGRNDHGQLGDQTTTGSTTPVDVLGLGGPATMAFAGEGSSCAALSSGLVQCWGENTYGGLGNGTTTDSLIPVTVSGITTALKVETNSYNACALLSGGGVKCWGSNMAGALGNGGYSDSSVPVDVIGLQSGVTELSARALHACVVLDGNGAKCWGNNYAGELGNRKTGSSNKPVDVVW